MQRAEQKTAVQTKQKGCHEIKESSGLDLSPQLQGKNHEQMPASALSTCSASLTHQKEKSAHARRPIPK
jgi:hypothetical protein